MSQICDRGMTPDCSLGPKEVPSSMLLIIYTSVSSIPISYSNAVPTSLQTPFDGAGWVPKNLHRESKETQCLNNLVIQFCFVFLKKT